MSRQGYPHGYKPVNTWVREYPGKPGRRSSAREDARRQAFFDAVQAEQRMVPQPEKGDPEIPSLAEEPQMEVDPLASPRHLTWLLFRKAEGLKRDSTAMANALTLFYRNGPVEGQVNRLKYVKQSMSGRGSSELLRQRFLQAS